MVVADAGRDRNAPPADEILCLADGRFGFRVADPATGRRHGVLGYDSVKEARAAEDEAERLRLYYVAMTRAIDRLIVSGSIDPGGKADKKTPIGWVLGRLDCADELAQAGERPLELEREGARVVVRVDRTPPPDETAAGRVAAVVDETTGQLALFAAGAEPKLPPLAALATSTPCRSRRCTTCAGCPTAPSRSSSAAPTATTQSAWPGCGPHRRTGRSPARRGWSRPRSAMPCTGCWSSSTCRRRLRRSSSRCGRGIRP